MSKAQDELREPTGLGYYTPIDMPPAPAPQSMLGADLHSSLINALAATTFGFHSSQLEAIAPIIEAYKDNAVSEARVIERLETLKDVRSHLFDGLSNRDSKNLDIAIIAIEVECINLKGEDK